MVKKSFKSGLDSILSSNKYITKKEAPTKIKKELPDDEKHWLLIKNERLQKELHLWRTGKLTVEKFEVSLKKHNLRYSSKTNEIM